MPLRLRWLLVGTCLLVGGFAFGALPEKPSTYVADRAGILSAKTVSTLNAKLEAYERETSNQILVATFPALPSDYALEDFTQRTAEAWGVGQKGRDNGAVLFVFPSDRKMRIEVGYGLEGVLPDATAKSIIEYEIKPAFKAGDFDAGITRGVNAMIQATKGEYQGTGRTNADREDGGSDAGQFVILLIVVIFILIVMSGGGGTSYGSRGRKGGSSMWFPMGGGGGSGRGGGGFGGGGGFSGGGGSFGGGGASGGW